MAKKTSRPGRTLLVFFLAVAVLYGLAALGKTWKPTLGLDLEGGTEITLTATKNPGQTKLKQAADIVRQRVNGSGVTEATVGTQGGRNIVVQIPGKNAGNLVDTAKRTALLRFRLVYGSPQSGLPTSSTATPSASSSASAKPSAGASASASAQNKSKSKSKSKSSASASPKPRPAPAFAEKSVDKKKAKKGGKKATAKKSASATATPSASASSSAVTQTAQGASIDDPLKWVQNPGTAWLAKYAAFTCPTTKDAAAQVVDDPDKPLITCDSSGDKYLLSKAVIEGTSLKSASYGTPQNGVGWEVNLQLKGSAVKTFATVSQNLLSTGGYFAIVLDGQVVSAPGFTSSILNGLAQITGSFTEAEAKSLADSLKYGALPVKLNVASTQVIGPSLAGNQLSAGLLAGLIGLLIVMLYCLFYYRGLGVVVISSLVVAAIITYATVLVLAKAAGFTLTLPGIAGLIVAVGITADSFIVYFERIRDEMRDGKSMRVAVEAGWKRARNTCLAADSVSFLAALVLYIFAVDVVKGFAFALGVTTIIDVVVFFFFTKPMMTFLARRRFFNSGHRLSGLSKETLGVDEDPRLVGGRA